MRNTYSKKTILASNGAIILSSAIALFLSACKKEEKPAQIMPPMPVTLAAAVEKDTFRFIDTLGTISSYKSVKVVSQVTGQIMSVNFKQGEFVKEGDILAVIDKRPYEAQVLAAKAQLVQAESKLKIDELAVERNKKLAESKYVDKQSYDALVATVDSDKGAVEAAKAQLMLAQINLDWCTIKSPISGKAGFFQIDAGNIASANVSVITNIEQQDPVFVDFFVSSQYQAEVRNLIEKRGGKLDLEVSYLEKGFKTKVRKATVSILENKTRYESATIVLRGVLENKDGLFWPNQSVKVRLNMEEVKGGVFIPEIAIKSDFVGRFVYVAEKQDELVYKIRKAPVKDIQIFPDGLELVEGVKKGEFVVSIGHLKVADGAYAYAAMSNGIPLDAESKPINPATMQDFMKDIMMRKAKLEAADKAKLAAKNPPAESKAEGPAKKAESK